MRSIFLIIVAAFSLTACSLPKNESPYDTLIHQGSSYVIQLYGQEFAAKWWRCSGYGLKPSGILVAHVGLPNGDILETKTADPRLIELALRMPARDFMGIITNKLDLAALHRGADIPAPNKNVLNMRLYGHNKRCT